MWDVLSGVAEVAWDVLSGAAKMAWDVLSGVTKTAWDVLCRWQIDAGCFVRGGKKWQGMFCHGMFCPTFLSLCQKHSLLSILQIFFVNFEIKFMCQNHSPI